MTSAAIRQSFLDFFASKSHMIMPSSSLMPTAPNLLFTNAGMNQFVPYFLGDQTAPWKRVADTQKCIRAGGKHNDLEDVGFDTYHHTMFEMLGNWSFGDYFKKESLTWGWELLTKHWGIPPKRLFATVFCPYMGKTNWENKWAEELRQILTLAETGQPAPLQDAASAFENCDAEAAHTWAGLFRQAGLDPALHILPGNRKDNFWQMGDTGPCGPCSEIHFNLLPDDDEAAGRKLVNSSSPRCIEIWNHVFIQFNANTDGTFAPLAAKHVDTGMGFERVAGIHATTKGFKDFTAEPSNYNADIFRKIFDLVEKLSGKHYQGTVPKERTGLPEQEQIDVAFRVLADHARCVSCAIADGILPGNEGRNYVIRRILRRGVLYGRKSLGLKIGDFASLVDPVIQSLGKVFPELNTQRVMVEKAIRAEEESFGKTLDRGLAIFTAEVATPAAAAHDSDGSGSTRVPRVESGVSPDSLQNIRYSKRHLPHFERPWGKYHVTFATVERRKLSPEAQRIVFESILHGHRERRYQLFAVCVMPDHVHLLLEPQPKSSAAGTLLEFHSLSDIMHSIKSYSAHAINQTGGGTGSVWEKESFDRLIRSEGDLQEKFAYIVKNPQEAKLADDNGDYEFLWTGDATPETARRDAEPDPRDAGAPRTIPGSVAFLLYDTYGFPLDMTQLLAAERGLTVDVDGFEAEMEKQRERGRAARKTDIIVASTEGDTVAAATKFTGYDLSPAAVTRAKLIEVVKTEKDAYFVFDQTPFYAEMGGQVGDAGHALIDGNKVDIIDCIKDKSGRHLHKIGGPSSSEAASIPIGSDSILHVDYKRRRAINRHHSAAHLIHWALRKMLGTHVRQFGTHKTPDRMRFDFTHFEALTAAQIKECEQLINEKVIDNARVVSSEIEYEKRPPDVLAFFGDKYGKYVRLVDIGGFSKELCGGTHVSTTGEIGVIKIVAEMAIAAGTRRIEAVAGQAAFDHIAAKEAALSAVSLRLNAGVQDVVPKFESVLAHQKDLEKKLKAYEAKASAGLAEELAAAAITKDGLKWVSAVVTAESPDALRSLGSQVLHKIGAGAVVQLGALLDGKVSLVAYCSPEAIKAGLAAGKLIGALTAKLGGKGGGKPDYAQGGGGDGTKLAEVLRL